jgi:hypothetical protein
MYGEDDVEVGLARCEGLAAVARQRLSALGRARRVTVCMGKGTNDELGVNEGRSPFFCRGKIGLRTSLGTSRSYFVTRRVGIAWNQNRTLCICTLLHASFLYYNGTTTEFL